MDDKELQRNLKAAELYSGEIDGDLGKLSMEAVEAFLMHGAVPIPDTWSKDRKVLAAKQLVCREKGIEVGEIDGLMGPQTRFGFEKYAAQNLGGPPVAIPARDVDPPAAEPAGHKETWPRQKDVPAFYGSVGANQAKLALPFPMKLAWDKSKVVNSITLHKLVIASADRAFKAIAAAYNQQQREALGLDLFGGSLNVRKMRGGNKWSMHSWGIAIDFDPERNQLKWDHTRANFAKPEAKAFFDIWENEGWVSLGRARDFDWMHVQAARL